MYICIVFHGWSERDMISFDVWRFHWELWRSEKKDLEGSMIYGTALGVVISHMNSNVRISLKTVSHEKWEVKCSLFTFFELRWSSSRAGSGWMKMCEFLWFLQYFSVSCDLLCLLSFMYFISKNFWFPIHVDSWCWRIIDRICWVCAIFCSIPNLQAWIDIQTDRLMDRQTN